MLPRLSFLPLNRASSQYPRPPWITIRFTHHASRFADSCSSRRGSSLILSAPSTRAMKQAGPKTSSLHATFPRSTCARDMAAVQSGFPASAQESVREAGLLLIPRPRPRFRHLLNLPLRIRLLRLLVSHHVPLLTRSLSRPQANAHRLAQMDIRSGTPLMSHWTRSASSSRLIGGYVSTQSNLCRPQLLTLPLPIPGLRLSYDCSSRP